MNNHDVKQLQSTNHNSKFMYDYNKLNNAVNSNFYIKKHSSPSSCRKNHRMKYRSIPSYLIKQAILTSFT